MEQFSCGKLSQLMAVSGNQLMGLIQLG